MKKNIVLWIGIILIIAGAAFAAFTDIAGDIPALAVAAFGLGVSVIAIWNKSEKKDWKVITSIACIVVGAFALGIAGFAEATMTTIIGSVIGLVSLIAGLITALIPKK